MGDEETPDPGNLTHLASDREQETGDRRGLATLVTYTQLMVTWRILSFFLVTVLALLWFIPSCSACRSVHLKLYAKIVVILLLFATWGRIALALWCDEKVRGYSLKYVQPSRAACVWTHHLWSPTSREWGMVEGRRRRRRGQWNYFTLRKRGWRVWHCVDVLHELLMPDPILIDTRYLTTPRPLHNVRTKLF